MAGEKSGGRLIADMLKAEGVEVVFGIIDGTYFGFYASLREVGIRHVTPRHETSAVHMAGAYAWLTGKLGVCMASNGPGVANALPGIAVEHTEGHRVLIITSCRRHPIVYPDRGGSYQGFDQIATTRPITKWNAAVPSYERIPELMRKALRASWTGKPGVVHLDVPENIMNGKFDAAPAAQSPAQYRRVHAPAPDPALVREAANILIDAASPIIHAGCGAVHARAFDELRRVAELLHAPVTTSWGGRGALPETHPLAIPMIHVKVNMQVHNDADAVLAIGTRFGETDWWGKPPYWRAPGEQQVVQVDIDESSLGLNKPVTLAVHADARTFLAALAEEISSRAPDVSARKALVDKHRALVVEARAALDKKLEAETNGVHPAAVGSAVREVFGDDAVLVMDGGNTAIWGQFYSVAANPGALLSTFKMGMLGAGVAQVLAAKVARPNVPAVCVIGDGAMGFQPQEIETAVRENLPVVYVVLADKAWGMVKMNQQFTLRPLKTLIKKSLDADETINADLTDTKWDALAEAFGAHGERAKTNADLIPALTRARDAGRCAVVHVEVDPVTHMWAPSLKDFKDMHAEPKG
ncbi:thiamine pyrophosphate-binding protein [bacterium]|nr:thiamine pyrophosphate-binding protein [bacterium]